MSCLVVHACRGEVDVMIQICMVTLHIVLVEVTEFCSWYNAHNSAILA